MKTKTKFFQTRLFCAVAFVMGSASLFAAAFSDANWIGMGGFPGANANVSAAAADGSGNLYICGAFTVVGNAPASHIAKWNGSSWTNLGSGTDGSVYALTVSGSNVYAAGSFTTAGGTVVTNIARWDGKGWTALGSGISSDTYAYV